MYELTQRRADEKMGSRKTEPIRAYVIKRGKLKEIEPLGRWPKTPSRKAIKKNANAKRRRADKIR